MPKKEEVGESTLKRRDFLKTVGTFVAGLAVGAAAGSTVTWFGKPKEVVEVQKEKEPIKMGASIPLSGADGSLGNVYLKPCYTRFADLLNSTGGLLGRPVNLILYDDESDPAKTMTNVEKLITVDKVDVLLGAGGSERVIKQMEVSEKYGYATTCTHLMPDENAWNRMVEAKYKYSFPIANYVGGATFHEYAKNLIGPFFDYLNEETDAKTVGVANLTYSSAALETVSLAKEYGFEVVFHESFGFEVTDFVPMMTRAKAANPDVFMSMGLVDDAPLQVKAAQVVGFNPKAWYTYIGAARPGFLQALGEAANNIFTVQFWTNDEPWISQPGYYTLKKEMPKYTGRETLMAQDAMTWSICQIYKQAIETAGSLDQGDIANVLRNEVFQTMFGPLKFQSEPIPLGYPLITKGKALLAAIIKGMHRIVWPPEFAVEKAVYPKPPWPSA